MEDVLYAWMQEAYSSHCSVFQQGERHSCHALSNIRDIRQGIYFQQVGQMGKMFIKRH